MSPKRGLLITGASGNLGRVLLPLLLKQDRVYALYHQSKPTLEHKNLHWLKGDISLDNLGLVSDNKWPFDAIYHLAGLVKLGSKASAQVMAINLEGTLRVCSFAVRNKIPHLYYVSTAYINRLEKWGKARNPYEASKWQAEECVRYFQETEGLKVTIFRPSILVSQEISGAFNHFVLLLIRAHREAERARRTVEDLIGLPPLRPLFRLRGKPEATLNLLPIEVAAEFIAREKREGTFWVTHPNPPTLTELAKWVGEEIMVDIEFRQKFKASAVEGIFYRLAKPFLPYLEGNELPSDLTVCPAISNDFISQIVRHLI